MYKILKRVVISGHPGTGTTTLIDKLGSLYNLKPEQIIKIGNLFRESSKQKTGQDIAGYYQREISEDLSIDNTQKKLLFSTDPKVFILESRLGAYFKKELKEKGVTLLPAVTVLITTDENVRFRRVFERDNPQVSFDTYCLQIRQRQIDDLKQWQIAYPKMLVNPLDDPKLYDIQIDNTNLDINQTLESVNEKLLKIGAVEEVRI